LNRHQATAFVLYGPRGPAFVATASIFSQRSSIDQSVCDTPAVIAGDIFSTFRPGGVFFLNDAGSKGHQSKVRGENGVALLLIGLAAVPK